MIVEDVVEGSALKVPPHNLSTQLLDLGSNVFRFSLHGIISQSVLQLLESAIDCTAFCPSVFPVKVKE